MITYEETKKRGLDVIGKAMAALAVSDDHEANKLLAQSIAKAAELLVRTENAQIAVEKCDLDSLMKLARLR